MFRALPVNPSIVLQHQAPHLLMGAQNVSVAKEPVREHVQQKKSNGAVQRRDYEPLLVSSVNRATALHSSRGSKHAVLMPGMLIG